MKKIHLTFLIFILTSIFNLSFAQCTLFPTADTSVCSTGFINGINFNSIPNNIGYTWTCDNPNIGLASSGTDSIAGFYSSNTTQLEVATITVTASLNCTDTFQISIVPLPQLTIGNDLLVCLGDSITLNAVSNGVVLWNNNVMNGQPFVPTSSDSYIATAINSSACFVKDSLNIEVKNFEVNAGNDIFLCEPDTLVFEDSSSFYGINSETGFIYNNFGVSYQSSIIISTAQPNKTITSISDFNRIELAIEHSFISDLEIQLICPNGTSASILNFYKSSALDTELISNGCGNSSTLFLGNDTNIDGDTIGIPMLSYIFSPSNASCGTMCDELAVGNTLVNAYGFEMMNPNEVYLPDGDFSNFIGCPINGTWTIEIQDNQPIDDGFVAGWSLSLIEYNNQSFSYWDNDIEYSIPFYISESTTFTLSGVDTIGCHDSDQITVFVNAPSDTLIKLRVENSYLLNNVLYTQSGIYSQSTSTIFGCDSTITIDLTVINLGSSGLINIYPNPSTDILSIDCSIEFIGKPFQLLDYSGREVVTGTLNTEKTNLPLENLACGIYIVNIKDFPPIKIVKN